MKKVFYHNQVADITIGNQTFKGGIKEISISVNPKHDEIEYLRLPARESSEVSFTSSFDGNLKSHDDLRNWLMVKPYRQVTIEFNGFISEQQRNGFHQLQEQGFIFFLQFRQRIYPKLIAEISFLTVFRVEEK